MKINMHQWVESVLHSHKRFAIPLMTHPGIELSKRKVIDAVKYGEFHYAAIKAIHDKYPTSVSVANIMMDLTVEAEAFGCKINFYDNEVPAIIGNAVNDEASIRSLVIPSLNDGRVPEYLNAAKRAVENIIDRPVFAGCIGPVSLAGRLYDMSEFMTSLYIEPDLMKLLLKKCSDFLLDYAKEFKRIGANGIIMAEPAAGLLSAEMCDEFSSNFVKEIVDEVQDDNFLFILHNCGNNGHVTQSMISTGAKAIHLGNKIDIIKALDEVPENILVMGNLDPVGVFKMANPVEVFSKTTELLQKTSEYNNFIISTGCDTPPGVPEENIKAFFDAVDSFNSGVV
jgi:uroporphyrinogen decarboxylase